MMAAAAHPRVLIGFLTRDNRGPIPTVVRAFMDGLAGRYHFIPLYATRRHGMQAQAALNLLNLWYLAKHYALWVAMLLRHRPMIAHYPITSYWNLEKSLLFLATARFLGVRTVGHLHGGAFLEFWTGAGPGRRRRALRALRRLDAFVVLSAGWRTRVLQQVGLDPARVFVVNNPIDAQFERDALALPLDRPAKTILALGVMDRGKGVLDIIDAAGRMLRSTGFRLVLAGPERESGIAALVQGAIDRQGIADLVSVCGPAWGPEKMRLFQESAIFLLPSYVENFPLVALEAAAAGLALVLSPVGAVPEFFEHGRSAWFVTPGSVEEIAGAVRTLTREVDVRMRLAAAARTTFRTTLARERIFASLDDVYTAALRS